MIRLPLWTVGPLFLFAGVASSEYRAACLVIGFVLTWMLTRPYLKSKWWFSWPDRQSSFATKVLQESADMLGRRSALELSWGPEVLTVIERKRQAGERVPAIAHWLVVNRLVR